MKYVLWGTKTGQVLISEIFTWAVVVVIVWWLDLQLPVQSVPIIIKARSLNPADGKVYSI